MKLSDIQQWVHGSCLTDDLQCSGVSIDTRTLRPQELFIAIKGENFDGHDFVAQAKAQGACALLVHQPVQTDLPCILVKNTEQALMDLAKAYRSLFATPVIAVTGSCGKTTTRALLTSVFSQRGAVLAPKSSFNNSIGLPLTLLQLNKNHDYAVLEMGANHVGEIAVLTDIAKPTVAIITNAQAVHIEGFGSIDGVARGKGEIFQGLTEEGVAIINNDDHFAGFWKKLAAPHRVVTFSVGNAADVMAKDIRLNSKLQPEFTLVIGHQTILVTLPLLAEHNVINALAAAAAGYALGLSIQEIKKGLESVIAVDRRLVIKTGVNGATIIDDSYNANPHAVKEAIKLLALKSPAILVFGDMAELGEEGERYHQEIGVAAKKAQLQAVYCYGKQSQFTAQAFGENGYYFDDQLLLIDALKKELNNKMTVLVKGSNSMKMNKIVEAICE